MRAIVPSCRRGLGGGHASAEFVPFACRIGANLGQSGPVAAYPDPLFPKESSGFERPYVRPGSVGVRGSSPLSSTRVTWDDDRESSSQSRLRARSVPVDRARFGHEGARSAHPGVEHDRDLLLHALTPTCSEWGSHAVTPTSSRGVCVGHGQRARCGRRPRDGSECAECRRVPVGVPAELVWIGHVTGTRTCWKLSPATCSRSEGWSLWSVTPTLQLWEPGRN